MINHGSTENPEDVTAEDWSFTDGINTIAMGELGITATMRLTTGGVGEVSEWFISLTKGTVSPTTDLIHIETILHIPFQTALPPTEDRGRTVSCTVIQGCEFFGQIQDYGQNFDNPGVWVLSEVPVPPAFWLFGSGLLGLIGMARRKA